MEKINSLLVPDNDEGSVKSPLRSVVKEPGQVS